MEDTNAWVKGAEGPPPKEAGAGGGRRLRQARESAGLSVEYIAAELHLAPATIDAIERDAYNSLPAPVFVAGYLRNYARLLRLDPDPIVKAYETAHPQPQGSPARAPDRGDRAPGRVRSMRLAIGLITLAGIAALAALATHWWQNRPDRLPEIGETAAPRVPAATEASATVTPAQPPVAAAPAEPPAIDRGSANLAAPAPLAEAEAPATGGPSAVSEGETEVEESEAEGEPTTATEAVTESTAATEEAPAAPAADEPASVELAFDGPCWVDIRDATREFKLFGEMSAGERRTLGGTPPYSVIIGNAAAVTIAIDGQPFDLSRYVRGNVARFTLDPAAALAPRGEQRQTDG